MKPLVWETAPHLFLPTLAPPRALGPHVILRKATLQQGHCSIVSASSCKGKANFPKLHHFGIGIDRSCQSVPQVCAGLSTGLPCDFCPVFQEASCEQKRLCGDTVEKSKVKGAPSEPSHSGVDTSPWAQTGCTHRLTSATEPTTFVDQTLI